MCTWQQSACATEVTQSKEKLTSNVEGVCSSWSAQKFGAEIYAETWRQDIDTHVQEGSAGKTVVMWWSIGRASPPVLTAPKPALTEPNHWVFWAFAAFFSHLQTLCKQLKFWVPWISETESKRCPRAQEERGKNCSREPDQSFGWRVAAWPCARPPSQAEDDA